MKAKRKVIVSLTHSDYERAVRVEYKVTGFNGLKKGYFGTACELTDKSFYSGCFLPETLRDIENIGLALAKI